MPRSTKPARAPQKVTPPKLKNHWQRIAGALGVSFHKSEPDDDAADTEEELTGAEEAVAEVPSVTDDAATEPVSPGPSFGVPPAPRESGPTVDFVESTSAFALDTQSEEGQSTLGFDSRPSVVDAPLNVGSDTADQSEQADSIRSTADRDSFSTDSSPGESSASVFDPERAKRELAALFADPVAASAADIGFSTDIVAPSDERTSSVSTDDETTPFGELPEIADEDELGEQREEAKETRRPRRRRGGRRRRPKGDQSETKTATEPSAVEDEDEDEDASFASPIADEFDVSPASEEEPESDEDEGRARRGHRKIPSWQDAVGCIVDKNLESRRNNPSSAANQGGRRRRGSGRGRRRPPQQR